MPGGYLDEMNERVRRVNAETASMFAAESARLLASTCDRFEMAATRGALVEIFRDVKLSELLPEHIDLVVEDFARLYGLKGGFGPNARPTIAVLLGEHLPAIIAALTVSFSYLVFLMMSSPVGFDWQKALIDFAIADSRSAAVWTAYETWLNVRPSVVVCGIWIAAFTFVFSNCRPRLTSVAVVALVPLVVPAFFALALFVTTESRAAAFYSGEQYAYAALYQKGNPMLKADVQHFWDLRRSTGAILK